MLSEESETDGDEAKKVVDARQDGAVRESVSGRLPRGPLCDLRVPRDVEPCANLAVRGESSPRVLRLVVQVLGRRPWSR